MVTRIAETLILALALLLSLPVTPADAQTAKVSAQKAHDIAVDTYLYLYPLLSMDITRLQSTNIEANKEFGKGPMNTFVNVPAYPPDDLKVVVRSTSIPFIRSPGWI